VSADGQRFFVRTASSIAGGVAGGVPTVPPNFVPTGQAPPQAGALTPVAAPNPNLPAANGLTVIRDWTAAVRRAVK
jgi:hypothetical protein